jgi:hypothetical protein
MLTLEEDVEAALSLPELRRRDDVFVAPPGSSPDGVPLPIGKHHRARSVHPAWRDALELRQYGTNLAMNPGGRCSPSRPSVGVGHSYGVLPYKRLHTRTLRFLVQVARSSCSTEQSLSSCGPSMSRN